jgi:hypothetical protein
MHLGAPHSLGEEMYAVPNEKSRCISGCLYSTSEAHDRIDGFCLGLETMLDKPTMRTTVAGAMLLVLSEMGAPLYDCRPWRGSGYSRYSEGWGQESKFGSSKRLENARLDRPEAAGVRRGRLPLRTSIGRDGGRKRREGRRTRKAHSLSIRQTGMQPSRRHHT